GRLEEAEGDFRRATQLDPHDADARANLGRVLGLRRGAGHDSKYNTSDKGDDPALRRASTAPIIQRYTRAIESNERDALSWAARAYALLSCGEPSGAYTDSACALALQPDLVLAHYARGLAATELGRLEEALAELNRVLELGPEQALPPYLFDADPTDE